MTKIEHIRRAWKIRLKEIEKAKTFRAKATKMDELAKEHWDPAQDANNSRSEHYYDLSTDHGIKAEQIKRKANEAFILACEFILSPKLTKSQKKELKQIDDFYVKMGL